MANIVVINLHSSLVGSLINHAQFMRLSFFPSLLNRFDIRVMTDRLILEGARKLSSFDQMLIQVVFRLSLKRSEKIPTRKMSLSLPNI